MFTKKINLTIEEEKALKILHKTIKDRRKADKVKTILLLNKDFSYSQISEILLLDDKTIRNIEEKYLEY